MLLRNKGNLFFIRDDFAWFYISFEKESDIVNIGYYINLEFLRKLLHGIQNPLLKVEGQAIVRADTKKPANISNFTSRLDHDKLTGKTHSPLLLHFDFDTQTPNK